MKLLAKILQKMNGLHYKQEYLCLRMETFHPILHAYIVNNSNVVAEVTNSHAFVGYHPLILAFPDLAIEDDKIHLMLSPRSIADGRAIDQKETVANLTLGKLRTQQAGQTLVSYYEGLQGSHRFIGKISQYAGSLYNQWFNKKPGNVYLEGNLLRQVQIAYALPRKISLITVEGLPSTYNCFPTDLHGDAGPGNYIISLRHQGKACRQVMNSEKILLSQMDAGQYKTVYQLGKNHMRDPGSKEQYPFGKELSDYLKLPVPQQATGYRELQLTDSFEQGIHRVMLFREINRKLLSNPPSTLGHVHAAYASWRDKKGQEGNYYLR
jgi:hypothetical protein